MNSKKITVWGYFLQFAGIVFLVSSLAGLVLFLFTVFKVTFNLGNADLGQYIFWFFISVFWVVTHFFTGKYLAQTGKRLAANSEEISKNPWLKRSHHLSTMKNLGWGRSIGYVMWSTGIVFLFLFGIVYLFIIFSSAKILLSGFTSSNYLQILAIYLGGLLPTAIFFFSGKFLTQRGLRRAFILQSGKLRSVLFYVRYVTDINLRRIAGYILCLIGFFAVALSSISIILTRTNLELKLKIFDQLGTAGYFVGGWLWGAVYIFVGRYIMKKGKSLAVLSGEELLSMDDRLPVLYLRSFHSDDDMAEVPKNYENGRWYHVFKPVRNQEELLAKYLKRIGPPIAVGMPSETLPRLGMARMYFTDDEWQEKVTELINNSSLVIMLAGFTDNFWWELKTAVRDLDPKKLIILLPFDASSNSLIGLSDDINGYTLFQKKAKSILPKPLPDFSGKVIRGSQLAGMIWFNAEWEPKIYTFDQLNMSLKNTLKQVLRYY